MRETDTMAVDLVPRRGSGGVLAETMHPSIPEISDTIAASSELFKEPPRSIPSSEVSIPSHPHLASYPTLETSDQTDSFQQATPSLPTLPATSLPSPRNGRSQSLAQHSSSGFAPRQPIRRKPLSAKASPLATRFSTRDYNELAARAASKPDHRFSRAFSVDSPTVYEFPGTLHAVGPSLNALVPTEEAPGEL
jgi:hypothetical protein